MAETSLQTGGAEALRGFLGILSQETSSNFQALFDTLPPGSSLSLDIKAKIRVTSDEQCGVLTGDENEIKLVSSLISTEVGSVLLTPPSETQGSIDLERSELDLYLREQPAALNAATDSNNQVISSPDTLDLALGQSLPTAPPTPRNDEDTSQPNKRRKTLGGLKVTSEKITSSLPAEGTTVRQLQPKSRGFPQRKRKDDDVHHLQPASVEKFIAGIWKQLYSSVELAPLPSPNPADPAFVSHLPLRGSDSDVSTENRCRR